MDLTERFASAVDAPEIRLDIAALCIAAHAHPGLDIDAWCRRLDALAVSAPAPTFDALREHLFVSKRLRGNVDNYADPENSLLDSVLERGLGIPITLAVVMIEVGRRCGVDIVGVGMPGHFLVQARDTEGVWCDPFGGGALLDVAGCQRVFDMVHAGRRRFHPTFLSPTAPPAIVARMLTNLEHGPLASDPDALAWMCRLHLAIPGLHDDDRARVESLVRTTRARWN